MAIWQFDFGLLPAARFEGRALDGSIVLDEYFVSGGQPKFNENEECENFWQDFDTKLYWNGLSEIFGKKEKYWGSGVIFGEDTKTCAKVWHDDISIRLDMRNFDPEICNMIVDFGNNNQLLFVFAETGQLHTPNLFTFLSQIQASRAFRFLKDPSSVLVEAAQLYNREN